jgi:hypothetical protein
MWDGLGKLHFLILHRNLRPKLRLPQEHTQSLVGQSPQWQVVRILKFKCPQPSQRQSPSDISMLSGFWDMHVLHIKVKRKLLLLHSPQVHWSRIFHS